MVRVECGCGKAFRVGGEHAGRRVRCPACGSGVLVPGPGPEPVDLGIDTGGGDDEPRGVVLGESRLAAGLGGGESLLDVLKGVRRRLGWVVLLLTLLLLRSCDPVAFRVQESRQSP